MQANNNSASGNLTQVKDTNPNSFLGSFHEGMQSQSPVKTIKQARLDQFVTQT